VAPDRVVEKRERSTACEYCLAALERQRLLSEPLSDADCQRELALALCPDCGWWFATETYSAPTHVDVGYTTRTAHAVGVARRYDIAAFNAPLGELRRYLARHPEHLAQVNPTAFERLLADCLKDAYGAADVIHTGKTSDGGIDIKMIITNDETFLIQVKRRSHLGRHEGVRVVRELNGVLFREGIAKGMVLTTAKGYTRAARSEVNVRTPTVRPYHVELLAFEDIVRMLRLVPTLPYKPWQGHIERLGVFWRQC